MFCEMLCNITKAGKTCKYSKESGKKTVCNCFVDSQLLHVNMDLLLTGYSNHLIYHNWNLFSVYLIKKKKEEKSEDLLV